MRDTPIRDTTGENTRQNPSPFDHGAPTERVDAVAPATVPWGAPQPAQAPLARGPLSEDAAPHERYESDDEPFVPAPRWRAGRLTKVLVCVCLVLAGGLGGAALQKGVDARSTVGTRAGQTQFGTQNGTGTNGTGANGTGANGTGANGSGGGQNGGFGGRNRGSQAPTTAPTTAP